MKVGIITFHSTPNYGATLQCYALSKFIRDRGVDVEVINYVPLGNAALYLRSLFLGRERSFANFRRSLAFFRFVRDRLKLSGSPIIRRVKLGALSRRYDLAITGSDEVWKIDHIRPFDPSFYLDFCDVGRTRVCSYAASASTVTDLRKYPEVAPLLARFTSFGVRDPSTAKMVEDLTGRDASVVVDPTLLYEGWGKEDLPRLHHGKYLAIYGWVSDAEMRAVQTVARGRGLQVVCVGCNHPDADANYLGVGPWDWLRLIKHSELVVTNFFHGVLFALIFGRPLFAYVSEPKRMKLQHALFLVGLADRLHSELSDIAACGFDACVYDMDKVQRRLESHRRRSRAYVQELLDAPTTHLNLAA